MIDRCIHTYIHTYTHTYTHTHTHTHTHAHNGVLLNHKKEWNFASCNNTYGPGGYCAKWNKSDREKHTVHYHLCVESKK